MSSEQIALYGFPGRFLVQQQLNRQWISGPSCTFLSMETHYHEANHFKENNGFPRFPRQVQHRTLFRLRLGTLLRLRFQ
jgi:hypothetical protein